MMQDLAMYLLDIANNSIRAHAKHIDILLATLQESDRLILSIRDDGCGMDKETVDKVTSPFFTTRNTRNIGLGIAFFKALAKQCEGTFTLESKVNKGTLIKVDIRRSHIDTPPLGDLAETLLTLIQADRDIDYRFTYRTDDREVVFDTRQVKEVLEGVDITDPLILMWIKNHLDEELKKQ